MAKQYESVHTIVECWEKTINDNGYWLKPSKLPSITGSGCLMAAASALHRSYCVSMSMNNTGLDPTEAVRLPWEIIWITGE